MDGARLARLRRKQGMRQEDVAVAIGVHPLTVSRWERAVTEPSLSELKKLCEVLNVTEAELLNGPERREFEVQIVLGVKKMTGLAGTAIADNSFLYGVEDNKPQIHLAGKVLIGTPEEQAKARTLLLEKFDAACAMWDMKSDIEAKARGEQQK